MSSKRDHVTRWNLRMAEVPLTESLWCSPSDLSKFCEAFGRSEQFFLLSSAMVAHSMLGKHGFIFGISQHGEILSSLCGKHLPNKTYITLIHHGTMVAISITA